MVGMKSLAEENVVVLIAKVPVKSSLMALSGSAAGVRRAGTTVPRVGYGGACRMVARRIRAGTSLRMWRGM